MLEHLLCFSPPQGNPGIIELIDCFEDTSSVKIVTELCSGGDLEGFIEGVSGTHEEQLVSLQLYKQLHL